MARRRFLSGSPLDTLILFSSLLEKCGSKSPPQNLYVCVELLFFPLKAGEDQKKGLDIRTATVSLLKSVEDQKNKVFTFVEELCDKVSLMFA